MKRRIFNAIAVVSAVLCVGIVFFWTLDVGYFLWIRPERIGWGRWYGPTVGMDLEVQLSGNGHSYDWQLQYWKGLILTLFLPSWRVKLAFHEHRRLVRQKSRCCTLCGYDLRATPDRCPECGAVPAGRDGEKNTRPE